MTTTIRAEDIAPQPWKNGGGFARELLADAAGRWRISLAEIAADGAFSAYPGVERWFAVAAGEGVELTIGGVPMVVRPLDPPLVFNGEEAPPCRLLAGPVQALNLMLERGHGVRGAMRRAGGGVIWSEDWPLRGHFEHATRTLAWALPAGALAPRGEGCWIGIAP